MFSVPFRHCVCVRVRARIRIRVHRFHRRNDFCYSHQNRFELDLRYLGQRKYRSGKMYWMTFGWPWPKVAAVTLINKKFVCLQDKVRITQLITTKLGRYISLVMVITWVGFGGILLETLFLAYFRWKFWMCFFMVKHSIGRISGMVGPIDVKQKGGASVGYWMN